MRAGVAVTAAVALATLTATGRARAAETEEEARSRTYPLVFMVQGDAVVDSTPAGTGVAAGDDPPPGSAARLRRLRVGEDIAQRHIRWRGRSRLFSRVRVRAGQEAAEIRPAGSVLHEQRQMTALALAARSASCLA